MDKTKEKFLSAFAYALSGQKPPADEFSELKPNEVIEIFSLAQIHRVTPMIYDTLSGVLPAPQENEKTYRDFLAGIRRVTLSQIGAQIRATDDYLHLYDLLRRAGLHPMSVKGIVCRSIYPQPDMRVSSDEDILVPPGEFDACLRIVTDCGLMRDGEEDNAERHVLPFFSPKSGLHIELHRSLFSPDSRAYGSINAFFDPDEMLSKSVFADAYGKQVLTLNSTDHLLYLIFHAYKHFLHSGFGVRQVSDIALFARRNSDAINWNHICGSLRYVRADKFTAELFLIARKWMGIDVPSYPSALRGLETDESDLLEDLLAAGIYGRGTGDSRIHTSNITLSAVEEQRSGKGASRFSRVSAFFHAAFPSAASLSWRYKYLNRHRWLLPWAWISRICSYTVKRLRIKRRAITSDTIRIGQDRVELLKKYGIID